MNESFSKAWRESAREWADEHDLGSPRRIDVHALFRAAQTHELRAHLRRLYPELSAEPDRPKPQEPPGFHLWPLDRKNEWWAQTSRLAEAQKAR